MVIVIIAGCGDGLDAMPPHDGARLQIVRFAYDDGAEQIDRTTFYDTELGERCRATVFSDGARHCMPLSARGETVFVNEQCTQSLGLSRTSETPPAYFIATYSLGGEVRPSRLYRPGPRVGWPRRVWMQQDGFCFGPTEAKVGSYFALAEELAPDALARITEDRRVTGRQVALGIDTSTDGLVAAGTLYDLEQEPCELVSEANAGEAICIARSLVRADYFSDAECITPLVALSGAADRAAYRDPATGCWSIASVAPAQTSGSVFERIGTSCVGVEPPIGVSLHGLEDSIAPPALARIRTSGGARLDVMELVDGAAHLPSVHVFDRELGGDCTPEERDGEIVCVPDAAVVATTVFADSSCGTPIDLAFVPRGACMEPARFASRGDARFPIEALYTLPFHELDAGDRCSPFEAPRGYVAHALGPAVPADAFARASLVQR
jgi:hypothetical protein